MTEQNRLLLIQDLCARLPYGVVVNYKENEYDYHIWKITTLYAPSYSKNGQLIETDIDGWIGYDEYKGFGMSSETRPFVLGKDIPYLRSLSSMTKEEKKEVSFYRNCYLNGMELLDVYVCEYDIPEYVEYLLEHHFDYRGLIEKGLALEAPEGMYCN